jgi:leucyl aminopeptidase
MRYTAPLIAALAASASATTAPIGRGAKVYTLETAPGQTIEVTEEEKFKLIDVSRHPMHVMLQ